MLELFQVHLQSENGEGCIFKIFLRYKAHSVGEQVESQLLLWPLHFAEKVDKKLPANLLLCHVTCMVYYGLEVYRI